MRSDTSRTLAEFQEAVKKIEQSLHAAEREISDALYGLNDIWESDYKLFEDMDNERRVLRSPVPE